MGCWTRCWPRIPTAVWPARCSARPAWWWWPARSPPTPTSTSRASFAGSSATSATPAPTSASTRRPAAWWWRSTSSRPTSAAAWTPPTSFSTTSADGDIDSQGAGDQGMMFGYACDETPEKMPLPIQLAQRITARLAPARKAETVPYLRPDGKAQVTVRYREQDGRLVPVAVERVLVSTQHHPDVARRAADPRRRDRARAAAGDARRTCARTSGCPSRASCWSTRPAAS